MLLKIKAFQAATQAPEGAQRTGQGRPRVTRGRGSFWDGSRKRPTRLGRRKRSESCKSGGMS